MSGNHRVEFGAAFVVCDDVVRDVEVRRAAHVLDAVNQFARVAFEAQGLADLRADGDSVAALVADGVSILVQRLHQHLVRLQHHAVDRNGIARAHLLVNVGGVGVVQRGYDVPQFRAVFRPEQPQIRLHLVLQHIALVGHRLDLLHIQLVPHLRGDLRKQRNLVRRAQPHQRMLQRLPYFQARLASCRAAHAGEAHRKPRGVRKSLVYQSLVRNRVVIQMDAFLTLSVGQVAVHLLRHERHHRRDQLDQREQAVVQRGVRAVLVGVRVLGENARLPEAAATAAHVPVRQVLDEALHIARSPVRVEVLECVRNFPDKLVQL